MEIRPADTLHPLDPYRYGAAVHSLMDLRTYRQHESGDASVTQVSESADRDNHPASLPQHAHPSLKPAEPESSSCSGDLTIEPPRGGQIDISI